MATYTELRGMYDNGDLAARIEVAITIKAQSFLDGTPTAEQRKWARQVFESPGSEANRMLKYLLAKNKGLTAEQIVGVSDASLSAQIDGVASQFVSAFAGV